MPDSSPQTESELALSPPQLKQPDEGTTVNQQAATFEWIPVPKADSYLFQVAADPDFEEPIFDAPVRGRPSFTLRNMLPADNDKTLYWRVRAAEDQGNYSAWSDVRSFTVAEPEESAEGEAQPQDDEVTPEATASEAAKAPFMHAHTSSREVLIGMLVAIVSFVITLLIVFFFALDMTAL